MLGVFPLIVMFLITSITMQRERVSGTLERILTTPLRRLDLLAAYGTAFSIAAAAQATLACVVSFWLLGLDTTGSPILVFVIAIINAVLGVGLGLLCSAFARTEFQAVQFMPVVIAPQLLLCGIIVPRDVLPDWLQWISNVLPASYALEALQQVGAYPDLTAIALRDIVVVIGFAVRRPVPGRRDATTKDTVTALTTNAERKRPGRPPGTSDTRERILTSARELFARNGIDKTSIRAIAADAGVDPALVHHYFGTKTQLFAAAIHIPIDPMAVIGPLREVPVEQIGYTLPSILLPLWDSELGKGFIATLRSILAGNDVSLVRSFLQEVIAVEVGSRVDNPPGSGRIRVQFVASQLVGVVMARYILELDPFKSLPVEQIAETIAPNLQRYLTGDLPGLDLRAETVGPGDRPVAHRAGPDPPPLRWSGRCPAARSGRDSR